MGRPGWYMVCYDIADTRRLGKIHRIMKKNGIAAQRSVFFAQGTTAEMENLLGELGRVMDEGSDDIRAYPVEGPKKVWTTGGILESYPLVRPGTPIKKRKKPKKQKSLWQRLTGRG